MKTLHFILLLFLFPALLWSQEPQPIYQNTLGDYTPSVFAKQTAISYGLFPRVIDELKAVFEENGHSVLEQERLVQALLDQYQILPESEKADQNLSKTALKKLGIEQDTALTDVMQWAAYTQGDNSPAVYSLGYVDIWYGISPAAFKGLYQLFMEKQGELLIQQGKLNDFEQRLADQVEKYNQLYDELDTREDKLAKEAQQLLESGRLEEAFEVLKDRYVQIKNKRERLQKEEAEAAYDYAQALELDLQYREATEIYKDAVSLAPDNSTYLLVLADNLRTIGIYDECIPYYERSIQIDSIKYGTTLHEDLAIRYNNLGTAYSYKGENELAIGYFQKALAIDKAVFGKRHPNIAIDYNNLGITYDSKGEYGLAINYYQKALAVDKAVFGEQRPQVAAYYNNLGSAYHSKGKYNRAIEFFEKASAIEKSIFGEQHPNVAVNYNNLGSAYDSKGEYGLAIEYHKKALAIDKAVFGEQHPNVAMRYSNLGNVYNAIGEYNLAIEYYEKALVIDKDFLGRATSSGRSKVQQPRYCL
jgi:tetratricopeptide (TPR) repeat protein